jgi:hypothetical protein
MKPELKCFVILECGTNRQKFLSLTNILKIDGLFVKITPNGIYEFMINSSIANNSKLILDEINSSYGTAILNFEL